MRMCRAWFVFAVLTALALSGASSGPVSGGSPALHEPKVSSTKPANNSAGVALDAQIEITWDSNMDPATTAPATTVSPAIPGATTQVRMKKVWINHTNPLEKNTTYTVTSAKTATSTDGHHPLADHWFRFTTAEAPKVVSSSPASGATNVSVNTSIVVQFDVAMDPASTEAATSLSPAATLGFSWDGAAKQLTAKPAAPLGEGTKYTLTVAGSAKSAAGPALTNPFSSDFTTETKTVNEPPKVQTTSPAAGANGVARDAPVTVTFSLPMEPAKTAAAFAISPAVPGGSPVVNGVALTFSHAERFAHSTKYTVTVSADAESAAGVKMGTAHSFDFTTEAAPPPKVLHTHPPAGATGIPVTETIGFHFDLPMDQAATESAISASPALTGKFNWVDPAEVKWDPTPDMAPGTKYTFTVSTAAKSLDGVAMAQPHVFTLTTEGAADTKPPVIDHTPPTAAKAGTAVTIEATVTDDATLDRVELHYKPEGASGFNKAGMAGAGSKYKATIPASDVLEGDLLYYIEAADAAGNEVTHPAAGSSAPHRIVVTEEGGGPGGSGGSGNGVLGMGAMMDMVLLLVLALVIVAGVVAMLMMKRRKRSQPAGPDPWQQPGYGPQQSQQSWAQPGQPGQLDQDRLQPRW